MGGNWRTAHHNPVCPVLEVLWRISPLLTHAAEHKQTEFFPWDLQVGQISADFHEAG